MDAYSRIIYSSSVYRTQTDVIHFAILPAKLLYIQPSGLPGVERMRMHNPLSNGYKLLIISDKDFGAYL